MRAAMTSGDRPSPQRRLHQPGRDCVDPDALRAVVEGAAFVSPAAPCLAAT